MSFQPAEPASICASRNPGSILALGVKMADSGLNSLPIPTLVEFFFFFFSWALVDDPVETKMTLLGLAERQER